MATWTSIYIYTDRQQEVVQNLEELTDNLELTHDTDFPSDIGNYQLLNTDIAPNYLAVGQTQPDWTTIVHNSFSKMEDWGIYLSNHFQSKVIITVAQSVSSAYYFALYDSGTKVRVIETCYSEDFEMINFGDKFEFESEKPGKIINYDNEGSYLFDFESIEEYCQYFSLVIQTNYNEVKWTVLKGRNLKSEISEFLQKNMVKKPWWKFW